MSTSSTPASPISGANAISESMVLTNGQFHSMDVPLENELAYIAVKVWPVELSRCRYEKVWRSVELIADPTFPSRDIERNHFEMVVSSIHVLSFDYH